MKKQNKSLIKVGRTKWILFLSLAVVIGGVMSYGTIGYFAFGFTEETAISMVAMIPLMTLTLIGCFHFVIRAMNQRIERLLNAIEQVSAGNLDTQIDLSNAGEYKIIYENFNKMVLELKETKQEMQSFVNEMAHEFKTPITSISGFSDYLYQTGEDIETKERMEYLKVISEQAHRLTNLSQNTLLLSKLEATQVVTNKSVFSLSEQIKRCVILLLNEIEKKKLEIDIPEDFDFDYNGNEELMEQIWINLLHNAIKFSNENGTIFLKYEASDEQIKISIEDTGCGMDEKTVSQIFKKYYQNDTKNITQGNGIGLSIVKRIVELCNGELFVQSKLKTGSTFTVVLPVSKGQ